MKPKREHTSHRQMQWMPEGIHDPYKARLKLAEPSVCPQCSAVYHKGRWQWLDRPEGSHEVLCPACRRVRDHFPAGAVHISGAFVDEHRADILNLVRNHESKTKAEHPLERIMTLKENPGSVLVETTDYHLARGIGEALHHAYRGDLDFHYSEAEAFLEVKWSR
jgi:hypothetical protein